MHEVIVLSPVRLHREALVLSCRGWASAGEVWGRRSWTELGEDRSEVLVIDLATPDLLARLATLDLTRVRGPRVLVWGGYPRVERVRELREQGARAYLSVLTHVHELHRALDAVVAGAEVFPHLGAESGAGALSARELEVAWCYAVQLPAQPRAEVAAALGISENTLKVHLGRVRAKLGGQASTRIQLRRALLSLFPDGPAAGA